MALVEDSIAVAQQQMTCLGELSLASTPVKQRDLKLLFQILDLYLIDVRQQKLFP